MKHTHTTPIGGTFGSDDIILTVESRIARHEVEASITGDRFVLMRTESATQELALKFSQEFRKYEAAVFGKFEYDVWLEECAAAEVPLGLHEQIEVNRRVKDQLDIWLADNAERFGYRYERVSRRGR